MTSLSLPRFSLLAAMFALVLPLLSGCDDSDSDSGSDVPPPVADGPWNVEILMHTFHVNGGAVDTYEDGTSLDTAVDYVYYSALPDENLESFFQIALVPTSDEYVTSVRDVSVQVTDIYGGTSGNIYNSHGSSFVDETTSDGQLYAVYGIAGDFGGVPREQFDNVVFELNVDYKLNDVVQASRKIHLEVFAL